MPTPLSKAENIKLKAAEEVFVHLPVASEEDRQIFAGNVLTAVRAARPTRVVFSTSGFPIEPPSVVPPRRWLPAWPTAACPLQ
ncbi:hypothetical protein ACIRD9_40730 [Streptomyces violaceus]|uniref:hypothetical protein n=1 Tax=Streptomyces violaceus TaxID=1936 RepID=UPI0038028B56